MAATTRTQTEELLSDNAPDLSLEKRSQFANLWCSFFADMRLPYEQLLNAIAEKITLRIAGSESVQLQQQKLENTRSVAPDEALSLQPEFARIIPTPQFRASRTLLQQALDKALADEIKVQPELAKQVSLTNIKTFFSIIANAIAATVTVTNHRELQLGVDDFRNTEIGAWDTLKYYLNADASMVQNNGQLAYIAMNEVDIRFATTVFKTGLEKVCHEKFGLEEIIRIYLGVCRHCQECMAVSENANVEYTHELNTPLPSASGG